MNKPELMRQIADAMERTPDGWWLGFEYPDRSGAYHQHTSEADLFNSLMYGADIRPRPRTIRIDMEVPEPLSQKPKKGQCYYFILTPGSIVCGDWEDHILDHERFRKGIWSTMAEAKAADEAIFGALGRKAK